MSSPFAGSIVGSWLFTRSTEPTFAPRVIYHFTAGGRCYWESDTPGGPRALASLRYRYTGNTLEFHYSSGTQRDFELTVEEDGSVRFPSASAKGGLWWMVRLSAPEPYSRAFIDEHGNLQKLQSA